MDSIETGKLFSDTGDWRNKACVNCKGDPEHLYAEGYKRAIEILINEAIEKEDQDFLIYPIVFNSRHYLEILLKMVLLGLSRLTDSPFDREKILNHKLSLLWKKVKILADKQWPDGEHIAYVSKIENVISEFEQMDKNSTAFRYAMDKMGNPSLPENLYRINIKVFGEKIKELGIVFKGMLIQIELEEELH